MRIFIKGGVWKNSEDEILKAAVMKYGLNNWSRVASLLVRKSAKQCKARWYEWLDPSVKKTEWTREEEEKLLHLAKLFPTQWRTIAPIVGRTAHQCLEHYERLLDQAQGRDKEEGQDPRKVRPGEIDPHPETKPSRADAVDMDEDEKEMLAEARARLANTRGKKAKRKAREKQMEEARRLASLQKRRELKAAGIDVGKKKLSRKFVDYGKEVPFEQQPPAGFHEVTAEERPEGNLSFANISLQQLEGKRRDEEEKRHRKDDERKLKRLKQDNMPAAMEMLAKLNDPEQFRKRTKLMLPQPQLEDRDLEQIVRLGAEAAAGGSSSAADATRQLVGNFQHAAAMATPMRTPSMQNTVLMEAQNAIARNTAPTPLVGGENPELHGTAKVTTALPKKGAMATPNPLAMRLGGGVTPGPGGMPGATPARSMLGGATPALGFGKTMGAGMTPLRDDLSLNEGSIASMDPRVREAMLRMQVKSSLASLPAPQNEIEVALPETGGEEDHPMGELEEDAEEAQRRREALEEALREEMRAKQTQVVQQDLPRPFFPQLAAFNPTEDAPQGPGAAELAQGEEEVQAVLRALLERDAHIHPLKGTKPPPGEPPHIEDYSLEELRDAAALLLQETSAAEAAMGHDLSAPALAKAWEEAAAAYTFVPSLKKYLPTTSVSGAHKLEVLKRQHGDLAGHLQREAKRAQKLEQRLELATAGYQKRAKALLKNIDDLHAELLRHANEEDAFRQLHQHESAATKRRKEELASLLDRDKSTHLACQKRYVELRATLDELRAALDRA